MRPPVGKPPVPPPSTTPPPMIRGTLVSVSIYNPLSRLGLPHTHTRKHIVLPNFHYPLYNLIRHPIPNRQHFFINRLATTSQAIHARTPHRALDSLQHPSMASTAADLIPGLPEELARDCLLRVDHAGFPAVKSVCRLWRREVQSPDYHRLRQSTGVARTLVAMAQAEHPAACGGAHHAAKCAAAPSSPSATVYRLVLLDAAAGAWATLPPVPSFPHGLPLFCQVAAARLALVVLGGWDPATWAAADAVWAYDFLTGRWRRGAPIPGPRRSFFACAADAARGHVYVAGGHDEEKNALRSALRYDVAADCWERIPDMAEERDECKGVFHAGRFHVLGGYSTEMQGQFSRSGECFDTEASAWGPVDADALGRAAAFGSCPRTCLVAGNGRMYRCRAGRVEVRDAEKGGEEWAAVADVPEGARVAPWLVAVGDRQVMLVGSACHGGEHEGYLLDLATGKWNKLDVPEEYAGHVQAGCCIRI